MFQFDADLSTLDKGVWTEWYGSKFLIAHISNMRFQRALARLQQPHRKKLETGTLDPQVNRDILCRAMSEAVLLDWMDVVGQSKEKIVYTPENAFKALQSNPEFRDFVAEFATQMANYKSNESESVGND